MARSVSVEASICYADGEYEKAHSLWSRSASLVETRSAGEYQAFALDSLAQLGKWRRFKRELDRLASASQKSATQVEFVEKLYMPAQTWLRLGRPKAAGVVLAYIVLLGLQGIGAEHTKAIVSRGGNAARNLILLKSGSVLGAARAFFELMEMPEKARRTMRSAYARTITSIAGSDAPHVLDLVDQFAQNDGTED